MPVPSDDSMLDELLSVWQEGLAQGRDCPVTELCPDCPELAARLGSRIGVPRARQDLLYPGDSRPGVGGAA